MIDSGPYFDCDSHIVESFENLTRYQPRAFKEKYQLERRETPEGKYPWFLNGRKLEILEDATRPGNLIPKPGALKEFHEGDDGESAIGGGVDGAGGARVASGRPD